MLSILWAIQYELEVMVKYRRRTSYTYIYDYIYWIQPESGWIPNQYVHWCVGGV